MLSKRLDLKQKNKLFVKNNILSLFPYKYTQHKVFRDNVAFMAETEKWSYPQLKKYQFDMVKRTLIHAEKYVPYYRSLFKEIGFSANDFSRLEDLQYLPTLTKEKIKDNPELFISEAYPRKKLVKCFTGGSTSEPMCFYLDKRKSQKEFSYFYYVWSKFNYLVGREKAIFLKADKAPDPENGIFGYDDKWCNYYRMDSNYLSVPSTFEYYDNEIKKANATVLFGYPSSLFQLAKMYLKTNLRAPRFKLISLASENVHREQLDLLRTVFDAEDIFFHYGHSEQVLLAYKCPHSDRYQFVPQYGYAELLDRNGDAVTEPGKMGEIVGTGYGLGMPFIRYKTKDFAILGTQSVTDRWFSDGMIVDKIVGRLQEFVVTKDGNVVAMVGGSHCPSLQKILHMQYFQDCPGRVHLRYIPFPGCELTYEDKKHIKQDLKIRFGENMEFIIEKVKNIDFTRANKKMMVIQKLDISKYM